jgi:hypothetical protein
LVIGANTGAEVMPINKKFGIVSLVLLENTSHMEVFPADISTIAKIGIEKAAVTKR